MLVNRFLNFLTSFVVPGLGMVSCHVSAYPYGRGFHVPMLYLFSLAFTCSSVKLTSYSPSETYQVGSNKKLLGLLSDMVSPFAFFTLSMRILYLYLKLCNIALFDIQRCGKWSIVTAGRHTKHAQQNFQTRLHTLKSVVSSLGRLSLDFLPTESAANGAPYRQLQRWWLVSDILHSIR